MSVLIPIIVICILILLNGIFVAAEFAIVAVPRTRLYQLADEGSHQASDLLKIINDDHLQNRYFTTAQAGISIVSLGLGMYGEHTLATWIVNLLHPLGNLAEPTAHSIALVASVAILTYFHVVLGEMIPKSLSLHSAELTALALIGPMEFLEKLLLPVVYTLNEGGIWITKLLNIPEPTDDEKLISSQEIEYIVKESSMGGIIEFTDQVLIENILDLEERIAAQVMTPRIRIISLPLDSDLSEVLSTVCATTKTRYLVYDGELDKVKGVLHIKDLSRHIAQYPDDESIDLESLVRPAIFIPETLPLVDLLFQLRSGNHQIAIVFDEFGGVSGLITLEDLIEEVVGEIQDEFDQETSPIMKLPDNRLRVRGDVILDELEQLHQLSWQHEDVNTVGGFVMALLGRIPKPGDSVVYEGVQITVESVTDRAVKSVLIQIDTK